MARRKKEELENELEENREEQGEVAEEIEEVKEEIEDAPTPGARSASETRLAALQKELDELKDEEDTLYRAFRRALTDHEEEKAASANSGGGNSGGSGDTGNGDTGESAEEEAEEEGTPSEESTEDDVEPKTKSRWFGG
jgi:chromosome segregation ATPase